VWPRAAGLIALVAAGFFGTLMSGCVLALVRT